MLNLKHCLLQALFFSVKMPWLAPCDTSDTLFSSVSLISAFAEKQEASEMKGGCCHRWTLTGRCCQTRSPLQEALFFPRVPWMSSYSCSSKKKKKTDNAGGRKGGTLGMPTGGHPYHIPPSVCIYPGYLLQGYFKILSVGNCLHLQLLWITWNKMVLLEADESCASWKLILPFLIFWNILWKFQISLFSVEKLRRLTFWAASPRATA